MVEYIDLTPFDMEVDDIITLDLPPFYDSELEDYEIEDAWKTVIAASRNNAPSPLFADVLDKCRGEMKAFDVLPACVWDEIISFLEPHDPRNVFDGIRNMIRLASTCIQLRLLVCNISHWNWNYLQPLSVDKKHDRSTFGKYGALINRRYAA
jgi:hypothetical protein